MPSQQVLFKPTLAAQTPFRSDFESALSYFVGGNPSYAEDKGFAIKPYTAVRWENGTIITQGTSALAMGHYFFTNTDGSEVKVEYTFGYIRDDQGNLRINLHHSSLPFAANDAKPIARDEVLEAQRTWGEGIVAIGKVFTESGDYKARATEHINSLYAYSMPSQQVLFKPTLAAQTPFRSDFESALSYFVGGNPSYAEDKGFAIKPYTAVRWENGTIITQGTSALAMGHYFFTNTDGSEVKVEYTFGYIRDDQGNLRINLHHSSLPFAG